MDTKIVISRDKRIANGGFLKKLTVVTWNLIDQNFVGK